MAGVIAAASGGSVPPLPPALPPWFPGSNSSGSGGGGFDAERLLDDSTLDVLKRLGREGACVVGVNFPPVRASGQ